ncbi:DUF559 domain-containing protein [Agromyces atrinae]|uniref:DUF559 domain-containing protein n=1 Tax=Agromyces atrinae TaxID=592376 RepID=UPI001F59C049|nr:DUF559 domain-containing protein [Agromyces atrinae]MCI2957493.1 DUF559 domain-containing protein [Agromyces atrinae]
MPLLLPTLARLDGVAETRELVRAGIEPRQLTIAAACGDVLRIRRGWYALPSTPDDLITAIHIGGRLACVSAAAHYGWATPEHHAVHVCVPENASRLRHPHRPAVIHWGSALTSGRPRLITSRFETVTHLVGCLGPEDAVAALDSFLEREPAHSADLNAWLASLPDHVLRELCTLSSGCESYLESIGRQRLERAGIAGKHQVQINGVGRVDLVIDDWLVIEWDGRQHVDTYEADRRRDALLTAMGYRVLRFSYRLVLDEWHIVIAAVRASLDGSIRTL